MVILEHAVEWYSLIWYPAFCPHHKVHPLHIQNGYLSLNLKHIIMLFFKFQCVTRTIRKWTKEIWVPRTFIRRIIRAIRACILPQQCPLHIYCKLHNHQSTLAPRKGNLGFTTKPLLSTSISPHKCSCVFLHSP